MLFIDSKTRRGCLPCKVYRFVLESSSLCGWEAQLSSPHSPLQHSKHSKASQAQQAAQLRRQLVVDYEEQGELL